MKIITLLAFLMMSNFSFSQIKITGKILNQNGKPLESAEILLLNKDSLAIKSELTDQNGFFSIDAKQGSYIFQVRQFKEIIYARNIEVFSHLDLGTIKVEKVIQLQKALIEKKKALIERNQQYTVKGVVLDRNNKPVDLVTVALLQKDSIPVRSAFTDSLGVFSIKTEKGDYHLALQRFGKKLMKKELSVSNDLDLGTLIVTQVILLNGVTIEGKKKLIEQKIDRLIFNVGESVVAFGGTALDALKATPRIQVINERIEIIGKGSAVIMIDDRPVQLKGDELASFLKSLSADDIQRIEIIPTPPAKYNAEGNSGLVNIILKKGKINSWQNTIRASYILATYPSYNIGNTFNYKKDNLSIYASLNGKTGSISTVEKSQIYYPDQKWDYDDSRKLAQDFYAGRVNADYQISKNSNVGVILFYNKAVPNQDEKSDVPIFDNDGNLVNKIRTKAALNETDKNISLNAHFGHSFDTAGRSVMVNADYFNYSENRDRQFDTRQYDQGNKERHRLIADNNGGFDIRNFTLGIDFEHPFRRGNLSYGGKIIFTNTKSNISLTDRTTGIPVIDPKQIDNFKYQENIQALYADFSKKISKIWELKLGLRYEYAQTEGASLSNSSSNKNNYGRFFPSVHSSFDINANNFINLAYSRRIDRPEFWELNPFKWYINANSYAEGNPFLQPAFSHNLELTYGYKQKWFTTIAAQIINDGFTQIPLVDKQTLQQIFTRKNYFNRYSYEITQSYSFNMVKWWEGNIEGSAYYLYDKIFKQFENYIPAQNGYGFSFTVNNSFTINKEKGFLMEINYSCRPASKAGIYQINSSMNLDAGIKKSFSKKRFQVAINITDILKNSPDFTTYTNGIKQVYNFYYDNRQLRLSVKYALGNNKISVKEREFGNETERKRIK